MKEALSKLWVNFAAACVVASILTTLVLLGAWPVWQTISARHWIPANCVITHSDMVNASHRNEKIPKYRFAVAFRYEFEGQIYTSDRFTFRTTRESPVTVFDLKLLYPVGSNAVCFVDPNRPQMAVLDRSLDFSSILFCLALGVMPVVLGFLWWRRRKQSALG